MKKYIVCKTKVKGEFVGLKALADTIVHIHECKNEQESLGGLTISAGVEVQCEFSFISVQSGALICYTKD
jgi:hypothetical protein